MGIEDVRARLRDRQVREGARGTEEVTICLDVELLQQLEDLQADLVVAERRQEPEPSGKPRLAGGRPPEVEDSAEVVELKGLVAAKEEEARATSLRLVFRSLSSTRYQDVLNGHPGANEVGEDQADFFNDLADACLAEVWSGAERIEGLGWDEIREELSYGEWEQATLRVLALNRRKVDLPFSLRPSRPTRR